jgi:hypothetical protein
VGAELAVYFIFAFSLRTGGEKETRINCSISIFMRKGNKDRVSFENMRSFFPLWSSWSFLTHIWFHKSTSSFKGGTSGSSNPNSLLSPLRFVVSSAEKNTMLYLSLGMREGQRRCS